MSLSTYLQVALAIVFSLTFVNGDAQVYLDPKTRSLRDKDGRHLILHGVNVVYKMHPYIPTMNGSFSTQDSLVEFDMKNLQKWGMNHVRLGVMWEAVETAPGVYNETYLDEVEQLIN
jgi:endoglycosylceramidase